MKRKNMNDDELRLEARTLENICEKTGRVSVRREERLVNETVRRWKESHVQKIEPLLREALKLRKQGRLTAKEHKLVLDVLDDFVKDTPDLLRSTHETD